MAERPGPRNIAGREFTGGTSRSSWLTSHFAHPAAGLLPCSPQAMPDQSLPTILCITTFEKGQEFMRECKRSGWSVLLLTVEKLRGANWPRESIDETYYIPENLVLQDTIHAVAFMARTQRIDRIVALDEF